MGKKSRKLDRWVSYSKQEFSSQMIDDLIIDLKKEEKQKESFKSTKFIKPNLSVSIPIDYEQKVKDEELREMEIQKQNEKLPKINQSTIQSPFSHNYKHDIYYIQKADNEIAEFFSHPLEKKSENIDV